METLSFILYLLLLLFAIIRTHDAIVLFAPVSIICQPYMCLRYDSPAISLIFISEFTLLFLYFIKGGFKKIKNVNQFPFYGILVAIFITYFIGIIVSPLGLGVNLPYVLSNVVAYLFVAAFYFEIKSSKDLTRSLKALFIIGVIMCVYALIEYITQSNSFIENMFYELPIEKGWVYFSTETRYGSIRCQSLMSICISWGALCSIFVATLLYFNKTKYDSLNGVFTTTAIIFLIALNFFSGTRSSLVFLALIIIGWLLTYWKKPVVLVFITLLVLSGILIIGDHLINEVLESFSSSSEVSGSSALQRQMQFATAFKVISNSPLWGLGIKGVAVAQDIDFEVLGAESIWLQQLINYGLIGVAIQFYIYYKILKELIISSFRNKKLLALFTVLGWVLFCTMTSSPGLNEAYFLIIMSMFVKANKLSEV